MTQMKSAGDSRRSRRLVLNSAALLTVAIALMLTIGRGDAERERGARSVGDDQDFTRTDAQIATHLLESVKGANAVVCAAIDRTFDGGYWGRWQTLMVPDAHAPKEATETAQWIGKRRINEDALGIARPGLSSDDPCTRRVAVRIVGNVDVKRLDEALRQELDSPVTATRVAAILALGYSEQSTSVPRLRGFLTNSDPAIRMAAVWALGRVDDDGSTNVIVGVLKNDGDAEVRRAAAWALGQIHD